MKFNIYCCYCKQPAYTLTSVESPKDGELLDIKQMEKVDTAEKAKENEPFYCENCKRDFKMFPKDITFLSDVIIEK